MAKLYRVEIEGNSPQQEPQTIPPPTQNPTENNQTEIIQQVARTHPNPRRIRAKGAPPRKARIVPRRVTTTAPQTPSPQITTGFKPSQSSNKPRKLDESQLIEEIIIDKSQKPFDSSANVLKTNQRPRVLYQVNSSFQKVSVSDNIELIDENFDLKVVAYKVKDLGVEYRITPNDLLAIEQQAITV